jgi:3-hydroxymyristoyl/3-hydroxydecanoyl-(acyl carrier protein) dehydratase
VLTGVSYDTNSSELLERLNWKNLENRFRFNKLVLVYNILNNGTAPCLENYFLHEAIMIMTIISEIMIQISHFQNLRKNFLKEALGIVELYCGIVFLLRLSLLIRFIVSKDLFEFFFKLLFHL